jgi:hypothetical protein
MQGNRPRLDGDSWTFARFGYRVSALHCWLRQYNLVDWGNQEPSQKAAGAYGHTLLYGGSLRIPPRAWQLLDQCVVRDFVKGNHLDAISEVATQSVFRAFFEFDPPSDWRWSRDELMAVAQCVQRAVCKYLSPQVSKVWVSTKYMEAGASGAHMVLPLLHVHVARMAQLRKALLEILMRDGPAPSHGGDVNWNAIVDESVSRKRGHVHLRKNLSAKCKTCKACRQMNVCLDRGTRCFHGRRFDASFYMLDMVLAPSGQVDQAQTHHDKHGLISQLQHTSILCANQQLTDGWQGVEVVEEEAEEREQQQNPGVELPLDGKTSALILDAIHSADLSWARLKLKRVAMVNQDLFQVYVHGDGQHACRNRLASKDDESTTHDQATIWFTISRKMGLVQHCLGSKYKLILRAQGPCGTFRSRPYRLAYSTWLCLFRSI